MIYIHTYIHIMDTLIHVYVYKIRTHIYLHISVYSLRYNVQSQIVFNYIHFFFLSLGVITKGVPGTVKFLL